MNDALFCSIHVDSARALPRVAMASLVAELTGGDDYGEFERRTADLDDFLGWPTLLEVMPSDGADREDVVPAVACPMEALIARGMRVLAQSDYAEDLPGGGELAAAADRP
jgi:hypothetical protein